jgi:polysaccharide deacetylase family protein (PEP-CTERM system associated)
MNILSFDIEEWWAYQYYGIGAAEDYLPRLNFYLDSVLDFLDDQKVKATFFCLGAMAEKFPEPVIRIAERGHQIGCHSHSHRFFTNATYKDAVEDTSCALSVLEDIVGKKVTAYRAPAFSLTRDNAWMIEVLASLGIKYDSSIFPARRSYGGIAGFDSTQPCKVVYQGSVLKEFPISITSIAGRNIAYSGGGYFRMLPYGLIARVAARSDYVMSYFHLMDFDKQQQRHFGSFEGENAFARYFKNYCGLNGAFAKFKQFVRDFDFVSLDEAEKQINWGAVPKIKLG